MNKIGILSAMMIMLMMGIVSAAPVIQVGLIGSGSGSTPIYTSNAFPPLVFAKQTGGRALVNDPYGFWANGNITERTNNYAFTGEQIEWTVLVWDKNGMPEKVKDVWAGWAAQTNGPVDAEKQANCAVINPSTAQLAGTTSLSSMHYAGVMRPNDQEAQVYFNPETMREYKCILTVEPSCHGQKWFGVKAVDLDDYTGTMRESESWFCNPTMDLTVSGSINFGALGPGEQGASTISVKNSAETGSGAMAILSISGKDFYDSTSSGAKCPTSNVLKLQGYETSPALFKTGFWYTAAKGSLTTATAKRIPYGTDITASDPILSSSTSTSAWKKWTGESASRSLLNQALSPGSEMSLFLHMGLPQPCNGQFTDGQLYLYAWVI